MKYRIIETHEGFTVQVESGHWVERVGRAWFGKIRFEVREMEWFPVDIFGSPRKTYIVIPENS